MIVTYTTTYALKERLINFYTYLHIDPRTNEVVYVGKGCLGRAWDVDRNRSSHPDHQEWLYELYDLGFLPPDWTQIIASGCSEDAALFFEKDYLHTHGTLRFNRQSGERNNRAKLTDVQAREIFICCKHKVDTHNNIAKLYGVSRTCVSMIASRKQWRAATACLV